MGQTSTSMYFHTLCRSHIGDRLLCLHDLTRATAVPAPFLTWWGQGWPWAPLRNVLLESKSHRIWSEMMTPKMALWIRSLSLSPHNYIIAISLTLPETPFPTVSEASNLSFLFPLIASCDFPQLLPRSELNKDFSMEMSPFRLNGRTR